ncbi:MAG: leucine-rich repeat domain-containing protein, partial [Lachnospiraceae bacterium]|nr:leucine-rich repeat domain-containing protein [Lachnospiraceae bacterium]
MITDHVLIEYTGTESVVRVPEGVREIGACAFQESVVRKVFLPAGIETIGDCAFYGCDRLVEVVFAEEAETAEIGDSAFYGCTALKKAELPDTVRKIGNSAFYHCRKLRQSKLPEALESIGREAFAGCVALSSLSAGPALKALGSRAFFECGGLIRADLGRARCLYEVPEQCFFGCGRLQWAVLPESVRRIGSAAFENCGVLTEALLPESLEEIGNAAFAGCVSLSGIKVPESVASIGDRAFEGTAWLEQSPEMLTIAGNGILIRYSGSERAIRLPEGTRQILAEVFAGCEELQGVWLPEGTETIGENAFAGCTDLTRVHIPDSVRFSGDGAFEGTAWLKSFPDGPVIIADAVLIAWKGGHGDVTVPYGVKRIADRAFSECTGTETVILPDTVEEIG